MPSHKARLYFSPLDLQVWRLVRDAEGYSSTQQVMKQLPPGHSPHVIGGALKRLSSAGHLRQRKTAWDGCLYGFTTLCTPPEDESAAPATAPDTPETTQEGIVMKNPDTLAGLPLTVEQMSQQVDLSLRLMQMALSGAPAPSVGVDLTINELALHGLMTAYTSLASADSQLTYRASQALLKVSHALMQRHEHRGHPAGAHGAPASTH